MPDGAEGNGQVALAEDADTKPDYTELGATGTSVFAGYNFEEYNPALQGGLALKVYSKMKRGDPQVRASLRIVKAPITSAEWYMEPASDSDEDVKIARFVWWCLNNMSRTFKQFLTESLFMLDYGHYVFEKVYEPAIWEGKEVVKWQKFAPRHPRTIDEWKKDANGGVSGIVHNRATTGSEPVPIPIKKLLIFTFDEEAGDPEGVSLLRSAYESWYMKHNLYKIDAIQKERHGIGIPDVELQQPFSKEDKDFAIEMAKNLRTNEQSRVVRPSNVKVGFLELQGQPVDALASAVHHGVMITMNVLAQFLSLGMDTTGARAISEAHQDIFERSLKVVSDQLAGVINQFAIKQLVRYNFMNATDYPKLKVRQMTGEALFRAYSVGMRNLGEAGFVTPDAETEAWTRETFGLPLGGKEVRERSAEDRVPKPGGGDRVPTPTE